MFSDPEYMKRHIGTRLVRKAVLIVRVMVVGEAGWVVVSSGRRIGKRRIASVRSMEVLRSSAASITFTWICTKMGGS